MHRMAIARHTQTAIGRDFPALPALTARRPCTIGGPSSGPLPFRWGVWRSVRKRALRSGLTNGYDKMFAVVRTGGKQYRVAAGDKIAVEKLAGEAGETITLSDVLLAGDGGEVKDAAGVVVSAEIIAQAKSEKVIVFKKRRRHNYRRKNGHRQQMTLLRIVAVGGEATKAASKKAAANKAEPAAAAE